LLVITVSFIPVFTLTAQEGRLFRPLAFTKTFSMFFASLLAITLTPALMTLLIRGKIAPEARNPVNRLLVRIYGPAVNFALRHRWLVVGSALALLLLTIFPLTRLGKEFMPPLNEGTLLYMPTAVPGMAIDEAARILQIQDRQLKAIPEVETVFGKAGQADTATDPAPLSMFETLVSFKPFSQWRNGMTWDKLIAEINAKVRTPGMSNIFWMPVQTRTEMLTTGMRSNLGIKVFGPGLGGIQDVAIEIEHALTGMEGARSVFAERTTGGYFLDFTVKREAAARYGLTVQDVNDVIETAIGGKTITTTVEKRERYPVRARYAPDYRQNLDSLKRVLVPTPTGAQVPIELVADINFKTGPPSVRSENGQLVGFVFVAVTARDIDGFVKRASTRIAQEVHFPAGYSMQWGGQFQYLKAAEAHLKFVVPLTLALIFILLYLNTRSVVKTLIVLLAVPFSLIGAFWLLWLLGYQMSVAVWVGLIALAGLDAETGVVMLLYLEQAWDTYRSEGRMRSRADLYAAIREGSVRRIRPKIMTVATILFGLLPIMWASTTQSGADVMKRIATPMIGGILTSAALELLLYPVIFAIWRERKISRTTQAGPLGVHDLGFIES
ncbi:MAG TPA: efflux RND transporter permease subunit, partial [Chthoniobacterales bacterium]